MESKMQKLFKELAVGDSFKANGVDYVKINEYKVSCCRSVNSQNSSDSNQKTFFPPDTSVETNA